MELSMIKQPIIAAVLLLIFMHSDINYAGNGLQKNLFSFHPETK